MADKICPDCKSLNSSSALYCVECGSSLKRVSVIETSLQSPSKPTYSPSHSMTSAPASSASAGTGAAYKTYAGPAPVVIVDFNMSFGSMVIFLVKFALAAIPAAIILAVIWFAFITIFGGIFAALLRNIF